MFSVIANVPRHCERSEAISKGLPHIQYEIASGFAHRNDERNVIANAVKQSQKNYHTFNTRLLRAALSQ